MLTIRPATAEDVPTLLRLIKALAEYERLLHAVVATEDDLRESLFGTERPVAEAILAELEGEAVGYALYFASYSTFRGRAGLYLEDLFVEPEHRGRGIGKALLREVAAVAHRRGAPRLDWSVLDWNAPSIAFYKSLGAEPLDEWTTFRLQGESLAQLGRQRAAEPSR
jgi:GNAT superfamily N-acetyltransferase